MLTKFAGIVVSEGDDNKDLAGIQDIVAAAVPTLVDLWENKLGFDFRSMSVGANTNGEGFLIVVRLTLPDYSDNEDLKGILPTAGDYCAFVGGPTILGAYAKLETLLATNRLKVSPDKYSDNAPKTYQATRKSDAAKRRKMAANAHKR